MKKIAAWIFLATVSSFAHAKGPCANEVCEDFYKAARVTHFRIFMESTIVGEKAFQAEALEGVQGAAAVYVDGLKAAAKEAKGQVSPKYQAALKSATSNKEVTAALKDLYTKWLSGITFYQNGYTEKPANKDRQYNVDKKAIDDAWVRVQTEAGI
jgi:hypothetical protein